MTFRVEWLDSALQELATLWTDADSLTRSRVTNAAYVIEENLSRDALNQGESRDHGRRVFFEAPLGVTFRIDDGVVTVLHVWRFREKANP